MKIYSSAWLRRRVTEWLDRVLLPARKTSQHRLCPYVNAYRDQIIIEIASDNLSTDLSLLVDQFLTQRPRAMIVAVNTSDTITSVIITCTLVINQERSQELEILTMEQGHSSISFPHCHLIIVQWREELKSARQALKAQGYYERS